LLAAEIQKWEIFKFKENIKDSIENNLHTVEAQLLGILMK